MNTSFSGETTPQIPHSDLSEFKTAAFELCGSHAYCFLVADVPTQKTLSLVIAKCERLLVAAKKIQTTKKPH